MRELLPGWGRWLNADALSAATIRQAVDLGVHGCRARGTARSMRRRSWRRSDAGLDVAGWTVRDRADVVAAGGARDPRRSAWRTDALDG